MGESNFDEIGPEEEGSRQGTSRGARSFPRKDPPRYSRQARRDADDAQALLTSNAAEVVSTRCRAVMEYAPPHFAATKLPNALAAEAPRESTKCANSKRHD